jgi:hypothetical protein
MTEQTDLEKITDVVTIITATIGAILGALGFWRSMRTERKVTFRSAFKAVFLGLNNQVEAHIRSSDTLMERMEEAMALDPLPEQLPYLPQFAEGDYDLDLPAWRYDRTLRSLLRRTISASSALKDSVVEYNDLKYPTSNDFREWRQAMTSRYGTDIVEHQDQITKLRSRDEKLRMDILKTVAPYIRGGEKSIDDLPKSGKYQRHLRRNLRVVKRTLRRFDRARASLERRRELVDSQLAGDLSIE